MFSSSSSVDRRGGRSSSWSSCSSSPGWLFGGVFSDDRAESDWNHPQSSSSSMMSSRRRSQEDDKEEDFVNKAPFVVFSLKRKYNLSLSLSLFSLLFDVRSIARLSGGVKQYYSRLSIKKLLSLLLLNPKKRAFQRLLLLSRAARRRKSLESV